MEVLVSVIIPVYNVISYLNEGIDSVINQTYKNLDIIIIDDGSTDGSSEICDEYKKIDNRIQVVHQENRGLSGARNTGLEIMKGDVVAFLDPDDKYLPNMIETLLHNMKKYEADISVCSVYLCNELHKMNEKMCKNIINSGNGLISSKCALNLMISGKLYPTVWNKLYKRYLFDNIRFPDGYVFEDQIISPYLFDKAKNIILTEESLIIHRTRPFSITTTISETNYYDWLYSAHIKEKFIKKRTPQIINKKLAEKFEEDLLQETIIHYLILISHTNTVSKKIRRITNKEINNRAELINHFSLKTILLYCLYKINPYLLIVLLHCYHIIKDIVIVVKRVLRKIYE